MKTLQSLRDSNDVSPSATDKRPRPSDFYAHESDPQRLNSKRVSASPIIEVVLELELICPKAESSKAGNASGTGTYDPHAVTNRMKNISESSYPCYYPCPCSHFHSCSSFTLPFLFICFNSFNNFFWSEPGVQLRSGGCVVMGNDILDLVKDGINLCLVKDDILDLVTESRAKGTPTAKA